MNRLQNLLTIFIAVTFRSDSPMGHETVFSKILSLLGSNSSFYFILRGAFGFAMDIPTTEEVVCRHGATFVKVHFH